MSAIKISAELLDADQIMRNAMQISGQPNPVAPPDLSSKSHWMLIVVKNQTQFSISPLSPHYFYTGKYWTPPQLQGPFSQMLFSACNRQTDPRGATGGTAFKVRLDNAHSYDFAVGWTDPVVGPFRTSAVASSSAEDGYNAATPEGNSLISDSIYEGLDATGKPGRFRLNISAVTADHRALVVVDQVYIPGAPMLFANGIMHGGISTLAAKFTVDGIPYHFAGTVQPSIQDWASDDVHVEYPDIQALTVARSFHGTIGVASGFELFLDNGVIIRGKLSSSIIASNIVGTGTWAC